MAGGVDRVPDDRRRTRRSKGRRSARPDGMIGTWGGAVTRRGAPVAHEVVRRSPFEIVPNNGSPEGGSWTSKPDWITARL